MADEDYAPVTTPEDEEEERKRGDEEYPAVNPPSAPPSYGLDSSGLPTPMPAVSAPEAPVVAPDLSLGAGAPNVGALRSLAPPAAAPPVQPPAQARLRALIDQGAPPVKPLHGFKGALDTIGRIAFPGIEQRLRYGPQNDYARNLKQAEGDVTAENMPQEAENKQQQEQATIGETKARTANLQNPPDKVGQTPAELTLHYLLTGNNGKPVTNPDTGKPYNTVEAYQKVQQIGQDVKPEKERKTEKVTRVIGGVPHEVLIDATTGEDIKDEGQTKVPGESPADKRSANESAQVEREARQNIRKAEGEYRNTQKSVGQLTASIDAAKDGNGLLTSFVPTMEVLGINAANGVHRISPAEAQAANLPGSFVERFNAWFDKASGGKTTPELVTEGKALAKILSKSAYQRYKSTYDDESSIVSGYGGTGFNTRVPAIKEEAEQGGGAGGAIHYKVGADSYDIPPEKEAAFKKAHPDAEKQ